jgi:hypothetical protein
MPARHPPCRAGRIPLVHSSSWRPSEVEHDAAWPAAVIPVARCIALTVQCSAHGPPTHWQQPSGAGRLGARCPVLGAGRLGAGHPHPWSPGSETRRVQSPTANLVGRIRREEGAPPRSALYSREVVEQFVTLVREAVTLLRGFVDLQGSRAVPGSWAVLGSRGQTGFWGLLASPVSRAVRRAVEPLGEPSSR